MRIKVIFTRCTFFSFLIYKKTLDSEEFKMEHTEDPLGDRPDLTLDRF